MISFSEAINIIGKQKPLGIKTLTFKKNYDSALGCVVAKDIICRENVPSFNNSAMDGFAVKIKDIKATPIKVSVQGTISAGDSIEPNDSYNGIWEIMTGAQIPDNYDAVIKVEDVEILSYHTSEQAPKQAKEILIKKNLCPKQNIKSIGTDFAIGDIVVKQGEVITPLHIMALASTGISKINVYHTPSVSIIATGKELNSDPAASLNSGMIRNSNSFYLQSVCKDKNIKVISSETIHDQVNIFERRLKKAVNGEANIIISTGAVSVGRLDFVADSIKKLGAKILFHKVAIRPGKPILFARFPNGTFYFGLPGNPGSAAVGFCIFVQALLKRLQGFSIASPSDSSLKSSYYAKLASTYKKHIGFRYFCKAYVSADSKGQLSVSILTEQESYKTNPMTKTNCWVVLNEDSSQVNKSEIVEFIPLSFSYGSLYLNPINSFAER